MFGNSCRIQIVFGNLKNGFSVYFIRVYTLSDSLHGIFWGSGLHPRVGDYATLLIANFFNGLLMRQYKESPVKVGLFYNLRELFDRNPDQPVDADADWDVSDTIQEVFAGLNVAGYEAIDFGNPDKLLNETHLTKIDLVFSICEMQGYRFRESIVPSLCEFLRKPYVFSSPDTLMISLDKNLCNFIVHQAGGNVPKWRIIDDTCSSTQPMADLLSDLGSFPYIVKPSAEGSGMGIDHGSIVNDPLHLTKRITHLIQQYQQPAMIQEYMPSREFTVGLVEHAGELMVMHPLEIKPRIDDPTFVYDYNTKENADDLVDFIPLKGEPSLLGQIAKQAVIAFRAIRCRDAARVDLRLSSNGLPHFIEINPLPHLHPRIGDFCRSAEAHGIAYPELLKIIVNNAMNR